ncbi:MAG: 16S rRNA (cytosine(1402)-N(4))-methyltransferase RsmH [Candidatus Nealsonbacteria bacterium]
MHIPVLKKEIIENLDPKSNENFIDCTIGSAGHSLSLLEKNKPNGKVLGIDLDIENIKKLKSDKLGKRLILINDSYVNLKEIVERNKFGSVNGILFDLGMSSFHLEQSGKGFSFLRDEELDMRYDKENQKGTSSSQAKAKSKIQTAGDIINQYSEKDLERILREYGEERFAKKIAKEIVKQREIKPIKTTFELNQVIKKAIPFRFQKSRINPSTKTFQAIRIAVNKELDNLKKVLPQAIEILEKNGRLAIISFHSLEDRIVKNFFKDLSNKNLFNVSKKPITASLEEIKNNPRSRSAKLRIAIKI